MKLTKKNRHLFRELMPENLRKDYRSIYFNYVHYFGYFYPDGG